MTETVKFPRLNHANYPEWSVRMEAVLVRADYWDIVTGDDALVVGETDRTRVKAFRKRQAACKAEITLRVDDSQLAHMNSKDPKVIWDSLAKVHRARGFGSRLQLRRHFITSTMDEEGQTMESWISEVRARARRLENIDVKVSDEDIIVVLTAGLYDSYTPIAISFAALDPEKLALDFVINRLLNEEARQVGPQVREDPENAAMHAGRPRGRGLKIFCHYCLEQGQGSHWLPLRLGFSLRVFTIPMQTPSLTLCK